MYNSISLILSVQKVAYKRDKLLTHPVVAALIHDKWKSVYGAFSFAQWFIYISFLCCLTIHFSSNFQTQVVQSVLQNKVLYSYRILKSLQSLLHMTMVVAENLTQIANNASCSLASNATVTEADMDCTSETVTVY